MPILQIDGATITDSTAIIAALEARYPEPPLYPADPELRRRALELEDFFDEQLGPAARLLAFHELINEPEIFAQVAAEAVPGPLGKMKKLTGIYASTYTSLRWKAQQRRGRRGGAGQDRRRDGRARRRARRPATASSWSATASASPTSPPPRSSTPSSAPTRGRCPRASRCRPTFERFREELSTRPAFNWVKETFRRHRHPHPPVSSAISG